MGFSATTVSPHDTPSHSPIESVLPFTSFSARRKNTGGFSRRSWTLATTANGQSFPGPAQVGLFRIAAGAVASKMPVNCIVAPPGTFHRFGLLVSVGTAPGKKSPAFRSVAGGFMSPPIEKSDSKSSAPSNVLFGQPFALAEFTKSSKPNAAVFVGVVPTDGGGLGSLRSPRRSEKYTV